MKYTRLISSILITAAFAGIIAGCSKKTTGETTAATSTTATSAAAASGYTSVKDPDGNLPASGKIGDIEYTINDNGYSGQQKKRGYYIDTLDEPNAPYFIIICSGEKSTGGYDINITDIGTDPSGKWIITVEETSPEPTSVVTEAFTYPATVLQVNKLPAETEIEVVNTKGVPFDKI